MQRMRYQNKGLVWVTHSYQNKVLVKAVQSKATQGHTKLCFANRLPKQSFGIHVVQKLRYALQFAEQIVQLRYTLRYNLQSKLYKRDAKTLFLQDAQLLPKLRFGNSLYILYQNFYALPKLRFGITKFLRLVSVHKAYTICSANCNAK